MKILIAAEIFYPEIGGPATYALSLVRKFLALDWQVRVISYSTDPDNSFKEVDKIFDGRLDIKIVQTDSFKGYFQYFRQLIKWAPTAKVIFAQGPVLAGFPVWLVARLMFKKIILKVVGDQSWEWASVNGSTSIDIDDYQTQSFGKRFRHSANLLKPIKFQLVDKLQRFTVKRFNKVIVPSAYGRDLVVGWGSSSEIVVVIPNAVSKLANNHESSRLPQSRIDTYIYRHSANASDSPHYKRGGDEEHDYILTVGRLTPWKGIEAIIRSLPHLLEQHDKFRLMIAGSGPEKAHLRLLIEELRLQDKVILLGRVNPKDIGFYYSRAFCYILNSGYENFPHTVLEAWQHGVPVLASDKGGNSEIIQDGENGILFEYNNEDQIKGAVMSLLRITDLRDKLVANGKNSVQQFSEERMVGSTLKVIRSFGLR